MNRKLPQKTLTERLPGIVIVLLLHAGLAWAVLSGLGRKVVEQIIPAEPLEVVLLAEPEPVVIEPPPLPEPPPPPPEPPPPAPPPPPKPPPPAPKPAYVPPPEVPVAAPVAPTLTAVQNTAPEPAPAPAAPPPPPPAPPAPPAAPAQVAIGVACPNHVAVRSSVPYPSRAERRGIEGRVVAEFTVSPGGALQNVRIASSSDAVFDDVVLQAVQRFKCNGQGSPVRVRVPFEFNLR
ncbi:energy transducer TonB [Corticibacter populi]|uniref:Energy transducer TonB n=1 Tax=Corticibacter populi TaxID=1550736 RepID=A0A3M6QS47_9BURK|nr:energy transducer TonB [Corticibacter populi]RMX05856.1 energy transducer TonB [Corticibacter populi]RZS30826.1 outer membrane transport energization protein TonB [Corticibacter populi]